MGNSFEGKIFKGLTTEEKLELITRALGQNARAIVLATAMLSEVADRLDQVSVKSIKGKD